MKLFLLPLSCLLALAACHKPPPGEDLYNPAHAPLTADELAGLIDVYHWKITRTPEDGKPYWGVRIVLANQGAAVQSGAPPVPYEMKYQSNSVQFDEPVGWKGNPQILVGIQTGDERMTGQLNVSSPKVTTTTRFKIPRGLAEPGKISGHRICSGTTCKDNRVDLIELLDDNSRIVAVVCLEFLHAPDVR